MGDLYSVGIRLLALWLPDFLSVIQVTIWLPDKMSGYLNGLMVHSYVRYSGHHSINRPFGYPTCLDHSVTGCV